MSGVSTFINILTKNFQLQYIEGSYPHTSSIIKGFFVLLITLFSLSTTAAVIYDFKESFPESAM